MLCASTVFAVATLVVLLVLSSSANMPTAVAVFLFSVTMPTAVISTLVWTFASVLRHTLAAAFLSVFAQTSVPTFGYTTASSLALVQGLCLPPGNLTMSLNTSATSSPMVLYIKATLSLRAQIRFTWNAPQPEGPVIPVNLVQASQAPASIQVPATQTPATPQATIHLPATLAPAPATPRDNNQDMEMSRHNQ